MRIVFRADAAVSIGTGHVMRCLALADALRKRGEECHFICRPAEGDLLDLITRRGHSVHRLPEHSGGTAIDAATDAVATSAILRTLEAAWLIVDHYGLGIEWERATGSFAGRTLAIDDVGRPHHCDLLLDQNFANPVHARYRTALQAGTQLLLGPDYALVRPEFAARRPASLARRDGCLTRVLVSMGGTDPGNETAKVLTGLVQGGRDLWLDVVVGAGNPHLRAIEALCRGLPKATLHVQTDRIAELMQAADCAITAGGSTTWERCCLGLPALVTIASDNQAAIADAVARAGAQKLLGWAVETSAESYAHAVAALLPEQLCAMSAAAAQICDGRGTDRVADRLQLAEQDQ